MGKRGRQADQSGFVAIFVASMVIIILALITVGFTRVMQREQRQALDRQLSRQALYAAESGINDVFDQYTSGGGALPSSKEDCDATSFNNVLSAESGVEYTCVLYDSDPVELVYEVSPTESKIVPVKVDPLGGVLSELTIEWGNSEDTNNVVSRLPTCTDAGIFNPSRTNTIPLLKVDLTDTVTLSRASLVANTEYLYLSPCQGATPAYTYDASSRGDVVAVGCNGTGTYPCSFTISSGLGSSEYLARIKPVYAGANVRINGVVVSGDAAEFIDTQISIDVTAKANDVVRRLRAAAPFASAENPPEAVFQAFDGVCKLLKVDGDSGSQSVTDECTYPYP